MLSLVMFFDYVGLGSYKKGNLDPGFTEIKAGFHSVLGKNVLILFRRRLERGIAKSSDV